MPPVFGPWSPSRARLKSWAGSSGTAVTPSVTANSDTSGPSRNSSITTVPQAPACARAASRSVVTSTPLPAARASSLTTYGGPNAASAWSASAWRTAGERGRGRDARLGHDLLGEGLRALDPGRGRVRAEAGDPGLAQGVGGARDQRCLRADDDQVGAELAGQREDAVRRGRRVRVGLRPGPRCRGCPGRRGRRRGQRSRARTRACSRPPDPMTRMRTPGAYRRATGAGR